MRPSHSWSALKSPCQARSMHSPNSENPTGSPDRLTPLVIPLGLLLGWWGLLIELGQPTWRLG